MCMERKRNKKFFGMKTCIELILQGKIYVGEHIAFEQKFNYI